MITGLKHALRMALVLPLLLLAPSVTAVEIFEEIVEQKHALDPDGTLSIHNTDGAIRVYGGDGAEVFILAIKKAYTSERLKKIAVEVKATQKTIAIGTVFPPKENALSLSDRSGTVDYIVTVPQTIRITKLALVNGEISVEGLRGGSATARVVNGWLAAHNCFGGLDLTSENGRLDILYDWWEETKFSVKLSSPYGNTRVLLPTDASAGITARTGTGRIANAFEMKKETSGDPVRSLNFSIRPEPKTAFEINSISGDIWIDKTY